MIVEIDGKRIDWTFKALPQSGDRIWMDGKCYLVNGRDFTIGKDHYGDPTPSKIIKLNTIIL